MAIINLVTLQDALGGAEPISAVVTAVATRGDTSIPRVSGSAITFPQKVTVNIVNGVPQENFDLVDLPANYYWKLDVYHSGNAPYRLNVIIPNGVGPFDFSELTVVDPLTAFPDENPSLAAAFLAQIEVVAARAKSFADASQASTNTVLDLMPNIIVSGEVVGRDLILTNIAGITFNAGDVTGADSTIVGPQGVQGVQGIIGLTGGIGLTGAVGGQGVQGNIGAQGPIGPAGLTWRGVWSASTDYINDDSVFYSGSSWFAAGDPPTGAVPVQGSEYWNPMALQGIAGDQGIQGLSGVFSVNSPLTNVGTSTSAQLGIDQSLIEINQSQVTSLVQTLSLKSAQTADQTFTGIQTMTPSVSTLPAIIVKSTVGQLGNLTEWVDSAGVSLAYMTNFGGFSTRNRVTAGRTSISSDSILYVGTVNSANVGAIVQGSVSQTADLQQWKNSAGTAVAKVTSDGALAVNNQSTASDSLLVQRSSGTSFRVDPFSNVFAPGQLYVGRNTSISGAQLGVSAGSASAVGAVIRGAAGQTANLQEWQDSSGNVKSFIRSDGLINSGAGMLIRNAWVNGYIANTVYGVTGDNSSNTVSIIRGAPSQSANLQEWQDSAGTVVASVLASGLIQSSAIKAIPGGGAYGVFSHAQSATAIPVVARAASGQSANLQEWQDSSGNILVKVSANGSLGIDAIVGASGSAVRAVFSSATESVLITSPSAGYRAVVARGAAGQTANLQEWQSSAGTVLAKIASDGSFTTGSSMATSLLRDGGGAVAITLAGSKNIAIGGVYPGSFGSGQGMLNIGNATVVPSSNPTGGGVLYSEGGALNWMGTSGTAQAIINGDGTSQFANLTGGNTFTGDQNISGSIRVNNLTSSGGRVFFGSTGDYGAFLNLTVVSSGRPGIVIRGNASQAANLQEWQDSSGGVKVSVNSGGVLVTNVGTYFTGNGGSASQSVSGSASTVGAIVKGAAGQTANLQEWQNSSGVVKAQIRPSGDFAAPGITASWNMVVNAGSGGGTLGLLVKGAAAQTANLQEWQTSAGTVIAAVTPTGQLRAATISVSASSTANMQEWIYGAVAAKISYDGAATFRTLTTTQATTSLFAGPISVVAAPDSSGGIAAIRAYSPEDGDYGTAPIFQVYDTTNTSVVTQITADGHITAPSIYLSGPSYQTPIVSRGAAGQSANLQEWQDSSGTVRARMNAYGDLTSGAITASYSFRANSGSASTVGAIVKGAPSQTANLQEWQNSAGSDIARVRGAGQIGIGSIITGTALAVNLDAIGGAQVGIAVKAASSQTASLQEWQDSTGNVLANINFAGALNTSDVRASGVVTTYGIRDLSGSGSYIDMTSNPVAIRTRSATNRGLTVIGAAAQTANLQEWQNSAGTVVASVDAVGRAIVGDNGIRVSASNFASIARTGSTGYLELFSNNETVAVPGANRGRIYFKSGTTTGTLKLVVRAGTAGLEETIMDNIGQTATLSATIFGGTP